MPHAGQSLTARVKIGRTPGACWIWLGPITPTGHGKITFGGRAMLAHRWMWEQLFGPIPDGLVVYSTCDSKSCVNPYHLACGTQAAANRNGVLTKLLPDDVVQIREIAPDDRTSAMKRTLAERYSCAPTTIADIWAKRTWSRGRKNKGPCAKRQAVRHG